MIMVVFKTLKKVNMGDTIAHFLIDEQNHVEWMVYPSKFESKVVLPVNQRDAFSLVQAKLWKDAYDKNFSNGMTMFNSQTARGITLIKQSVHDTSEKLEVDTSLKDEHGNLYLHHVLREYQSNRLEVWITFTNKTNTVEKLEFLPSFMLSGISPFYYKQISGNLKLVKIRSKWSMEGRVEKKKIEQYDLEPSWKESGMALEKIEQHGSMPVRQFFPVMGIYDQRFDVTWMAELDARASWQLNVSRIGDRLQMFGGLPDRDDGNWFKIIKPNGTYTTPKAYLTVGTGNIEKISRRLQKRKIISNLPIVYNEWATTWGNPNEKLIHDSLKLLKNHQIDTYVIDAGWYESKSGDFNAGIGDWNVDLNKFPNGFNKIVDDIHQQGFKAGIWYEFEGIGNESKMYQKNELQVTRDGWPVTTLKRRFLDLTNLNVKKFLKIKLFDQLKKAKFDYLKVDYNDSIGIGADGADSDAEGVQKQVDETIRIFKKLYENLPNLVIESCSSGGASINNSFY